MLCGLLRSSSWSDYLYVNGVSIIACCAVLRLLVMDDVISWRCLPYCFWAFVDFTLTSGSR
jgi:hypothetical protein